MIETGKCLINVCKHTCQSFGSNNKAVYVGDFALPREGSNW